MVVHLIGWKPQPSSMTWAPCTCMVTSAVFDIFTGFVMNTNFQNLEKLLHYSDGNIVCTWNLYPFANCCIFKISKVVILIVYRSVAFMYKFHKGTNTESVPCLECRKILIISEMNLLMSGTILHVRHNTFNCSVLNEISYAFHETNGQF